MRDKKLTVQIQPRLLSSIDPERIVNILESLGRRNRYVTSFRTKRGKARVKYINVYFVSSALRRLWGTMKKSLFSSNRYGAAARKAVIVVCQGDAGWKDYLLLHHYDPTERLDSLKKGKERKAKPRK